MFVRLNKLLLLASIGLLSACASTVQVTGDIPRPLIEPLPLSVEVVYTDNFKRYTYEEDERGRGLRSIAFGQAQVDLFDAIFGYTLENTAEGQLPDLRVTPTLLDFQYSAPRETKLNLYEIWLKYRIKIEDNQGREVADWEVKGYGKTPTALLTTASKAFDSATNVALRDVGAQMAIGFRSQPEILDFIQSRGRSSTGNANVLSVPSTVEQSDSLSDVILDEEQQTE